MPGGHLSAIRLEWEVLTDCLAVKFKALSSLVGLECYFTVFYLVLHFKEQQPQPQGHRLVFLSKLDRWGHLDLVF
jgi:hypothetical protein